MGFDDIEYQKQSIARGGKGSVLYSNQLFLQKSRKKPYTGINSRYPTTSRITDSVALYLPPAISNDMSAQYNDSETGIAGFLALSGYDIAKNVADQDYVAAQAQLFGVAGQVVLEAIKRVSFATVEGLSRSEGLEKSFNKIFGSTLNPYIEVTYGSIGMRTFNYTFRFAPKSEKETKEVQAIIQLFRFHMVPEMKDTQHRYLTLPSTFDIHYMYQSTTAGGLKRAKENPFYNKIATCVLKGCDVNYTPNSQIESFADGAPTQIEMSLVFGETEMLTKQKINDGF